MEILVTFTNKDDEKKYFSKERLNSFSLSSQSDLILPNGTISVQLPTAVDVGFFREKNLLVEIDFKYTDTTNKMIFRVVEHTLTFSRLGVNVEFFMLPIWREGYLMSRIKAFEEKTQDLIPTLVSDMGISPKNIFCDIKTDDKMKWIQYNNRNYEFLKELTEHIKLVDAEDSILVGYNLYDEFLCLSYNETIKRKPALTFKDYAFLSSKITFGNADKEFIFKKGTKISEFRYLSGDRIPQGVQGFALENTSENSKIENDFYLDYKVNFGNQYDDFNFTPLQNHQKWFELENDSMELSFDGLDGILKLFDVVKIDLKVSLEQMSETIDGLYIVTGVNYSLVDETYKTIIKLSRKKMEL